MTQQNGSHAESVPPVTLGLRIRMALEFSGLKRDAIASKFEVTEKTVSRWCHNVGPAPKKFILNEIAVMCGVSPRWLIDGTEPNSNHPHNAPSSRREAGGADVANAVDAELPRLDSNQQPFDHRSVA